MKKKPMTAKEFVEAFKEMDNLERWKLLDWFQENYFPPVLKTKDEIRKWLEEEDDEY